MGPWLYKWPEAESRQAEKLLQSGVRLRYEVGCEEPSQAPGSAGTPPGSRALRCAPETTLYLSLIHAISRGLPEREGG